MSYRLKLLIDECLHTSLVEVAHDHLETRPMLVA